MENGTLSHVSRRKFCLAGAGALGTTAVSFGPLGLLHAAHEASFSPDATAATFTNPVLGGDHPDAGAIRVGEDYYLTHSSFNYTPGLLIWHSRNLVDWELKSAALTKYHGSVWAPFLCQHRERFYIYFPAAARIHVVHAETPLGPWSEPIDMNLSGIDPGHIANQRGERFLHLAGGRMVKLTPDGLACEGEPRTVFKPWPIPADWRIECECLEAPKPFYWNGYHYLNVAQGGTAGPATSHMVISARSRQVDGPWEYSPYNPVVHTTNRNQRWWSQGHGRLVEAHDGRWWILFHGYENGYTGLGRQTLLLPVEWTHDGWFRVPPGVAAEQDLIRPAGGPHAGSAAVDPAGWTDDFRTAELSPRWQFWNGRDLSRFSSGGGALVIQGDHQPLESTSVLATIAADHAYSVEVDVEIVDGCRAGLMLFYDSTHMCGLGLGREGIETRMPAGYTSALGIPARRASFRIENDHQEVDLFYRLEGSDWKKVEGSMEVSGLNQNVIGGFLSLRPALYAASGGHVVFRNFIYKHIQG